jgi:copper chaperone CopZ
MHMKDFLRTVMAVALLAAAGAVAAAKPAPATIEMDVDGLVCAFCAQGIEKKLRKQEATADVLVSLEHKLVAVALKPGQDIGDKVLDEVLTEAGYSLRGVRRTGRSLDEIREKLHGHE